MELLQPNSSSAPLLWSHADLSYSVQESEDRVLGCVCVCRPLLPRGRTQGFCNNLEHQLIDRAKISSMFSCILAGDPRAHHTARANEALYDEARKTYLQTSSWVLVCTAGLVTLYAIFMSPCFCLFGSDRCHVELQTKQTRISLECGGISPCIYLSGLTR